MKTKKEPTEQDLKKILIANTKGISVVTKGLETFVKRLSDPNAVDKKEAELLSYIQRKGPTAITTQKDIASSLLQKGLLFETDVCPSFSKYGITERGQKELTRFRKSMGETGKKGEDIDSSLVLEVSMPPNLIAVFRNEDYKRAWALHDKLQRENPGKLVQVVGTKKKPLHDRYMKAFPEVDKADEGVEVTEPGETGKKGTSGNKVGQVNGWTIIEGTGRYGGDWYISKMGKTEGPYKSRKEAEMDASHA